MRRIRDVLDGKTLKQLITIEPTASLGEAARLMSVWNVGALLAIDDGKLVGLMGEREIVRALAAGASASMTRVEDVMVRDVRAVVADSTPEECMVLMTQQRLRHVPVIEGDAVLGIISLGDLVKDVVDEQAYTIEQLERYISRAANA